MIQQPRLLTTRTGEHHLPQRVVHMTSQTPIQLSTRRIKSLGIHREQLIQLPTHPGPLRTLTGEQHPHPTHPSTRTDTRDHPRRRPALGQRPQPRHRVVLITPATPAAAWA